MQTFLDIKIASSNPTILRSFHTVSKMFIGITGPICSGKHSIAKWLVTSHGFTLLSLKGTEHYGFNALHFNTPKDLLFYVTKNWIDNFVTCDIDNHKILELYRLLLLFFQ